MAQKTIKVALIGNPNVGKTSVFNQLTGLHQQVGNYPGITVDKKIGFCKLDENTKASIIDLPGTYSLNASSIDENVVIELLLNKNDENFPDVAIVVTEVENLKRNLLLFTQIKDLEIPTILIINMCDRMQLKGIELDIEYLEKELKTKIALVSARKNIGVEKLKQLILHYQDLSTEPCLSASDIDVYYFDKLRKAFPNQLLYKLWLVITQDVNFLNLDRNQIKNDFTKSHSELRKLQQKETIKRYQFINNTLKIGQTIDVKKATHLSAKIDRILMHKIWGYVIFVSVLLLIFQSIFDWSSLPMDLIDGLFANLASYCKTHLPHGEFSNLISEGIIPGIGGIVIFIPQIAFLFLFISVLEESGYMSRVVFLMDKIMRPFGLSGKSVVPLISGTACAIPAIMSARNIENSKERLITTLVTPFITCSARLPVYTILIALIIQPGRYFGIVGKQGFVLLILYLLGFGAAIISAYILNKTLKLKSKTYFVVEMPSYKIPLVKNVAINVVEKTKSFVFGAGKIILAISIILWFLGSHGPGDDFKNAEKIIEKRVYTSDIPINPSVIPNWTAEYKLEHSYIGYLGKAIEPVIKPLGYDWKIGIAVVTSFAAREVFVGTLATIYSVGNQSDEETTIKERMKHEIRDDGQPTFSFATSVSLLLFYAFAMQCMSTIAIVKKETNSWKWPIIQLFFMSGLAYLCSLIAYQFLK
jgi:ferrous iron transport protein B